MIPDPVPKTHAAKIQRARVTRWSRGLRYCGAELGPRCLFRGAGIPTPGVFHKRPLKVWGVQQKKASTECQSPIGTTPRRRPCCFILPHAWFFLRFHKVGNRREPEARRPYFGFFIAVVPFC